MFRRVLTQSTSILLRKFGSGKKPPPGFEKFFKKPEENKLQDKVNFPSAEERIPEEKKTTASQKDPELDTKPPVEPKSTSESAKPEKPNEESSKPKEEHRKDESKRKHKRPESRPPSDFPPQYLMAAGALAYILYSYFPKEFNSPKTVTYQQMLTDYLHTNQISKFIIQVSKYGQSGLVRVLIIGNSKETHGVLKVPDAGAFLKDLQAEQMKLGKSPSEFVEIEYAEMQDTVDNQPSSASSALVSALLFIAAGFMLRSYFMGKGSSRPGSGFSDLFNMGKANFKVFGTDKKINVTFKDVAGQGQAKREITEFVEFLKTPEKFTKLGARMPRGALLVGPPGTGKTLLAKASAGEAGVPFFSISGSEFVEMFVGVGASRVRELFKQAREKSPSIIFIDEIDAVGRKRDDSRFRNDERDTTLNQLLVEMDGFSTDTYVIVMAATNRQDTLDAALMRPGRFDRIVEVTLPDIEGRQEILKVHLAPIRLASSFDKEECSRRVAALTPGFSGADLSQLCNEAAILAARDNKEFVTQKDFEMASEKVMLGVESSKKLSPREKKIVSYHEAGHAVTGWFLEGADPVLKVSILPRSKGALGFAQNMPKETPLYSESEFLDKICMILGGRMSEQLFFNSVTNGASDDLKKATQLAQTLVENFGMSESIGLTSYSVNERYYSEHTKDMLDSEVRAIINKCMLKTRELLSEKRDLVVKLAERLIEKEGVVHTDLVEILGPRPFEQSEEYKKFITEQPIAS